MPIQNNANNQYIIIGDPTTLSKLLTIGVSTFLTNIPPTATEDSIRNKLLPDYNTTHLIHIRFWLTITNL